MKDYVDVLLEDYLGDDTPEAELTNGRDLPDEPTLPGEDDYE